MIHLNRGPWYCKTEVCGKGETSEGPCQRLYQSPATVHHTVFVDLNIVQSVMYMFFEFHNF